MVGWGEERWGVSWGEVRWEGWMRRREAGRSRGRRLLKRRLFLIACNCWWETWCMLAALKEERVLQAQLETQILWQVRVWWDTGGQSTCGIQNSEYGGSGHTLLGVRANAGRISLVPLPYLPQWPSHTCRNPSHIAETVRPQTGDTDNTDLNAACCEIVPADWET